MPSAPVDSPFLSAVQSRHATTGVMILDQLDVAAIYEGALVFGLSAELNRRVDALRASIPCRAPDELLLAPHLTVLFLGRWTGAQLDRFRRALDALGPARVDVELGELGVFTTDNTITSVHVRVSDASGLRALHDRARALLSLEHGWQPRTPFVGDAYSPHVTIVDGIREPLSRRAELTRGAPSFGTIELSDLHLIGKRVGIQEARRAI